MILVETKGQVTHLWNFRRMARERRPRREERIRASGESSRKAGSQNATEKKACDPNGNTNFLEDSKTFEKKTQL